MNPDQISGEFFYNLTFRNATQAFLTSTPPPCPYERVTYLPQKGSLIFLKLGTLKVHNE